jgi:general nucleoside transport system permease protein
MPDFLTSGFLVYLLAASLRLATPILLAATGEVFAERAGILNLSIEGSMLFGAFTAFTVTYYTGAAGLGVLAGVIAGMITALVMAFLNVSLHTSQIATGAVLTIFALGATSFGFDLVTGLNPVMPEVPYLRDLALPGLSQLPLIGPVFFKQNILVYAGLITALLASPLLYRTPWGLAVRATGEDHRAAAATGINVVGVRYQALLLAGALAGLGGTCLALSLGFFMANITAGRGFIAIAAVVFGRWQPLRVLLAALLFGLAEALQLRLQAQGLHIPQQFLAMLPYVLTVVVLVLSIGRRLDVGTSSGPRNLGIPYEPESM